MSPQRVEFVVGARDAGASRTFDRFGDTVQKSGAKVELLRKQLRALDRQRVRVKVDLDDAAALRGMQRLAAQSKKTSQTVRLTQRGLVGLVATAATLAPVVAAAGAGFVAFGAVAIPTVQKLIEANKDFGAGLDTLNARQLKTVRTARGLADQYMQLNREFEPTALRVFNAALATGSTLMRQLEPVVRSGGKAVASFAARLNAEFANPQWTSFFRFLAAEAGPSLRALGDAALAALGAARDLTQALAPLGGMAIRLVTAVAKLVGGFADANPVLTQAAVLALALRGPLIAAKNGVISLAGTFSGLETNAARAGKALKLVGKAAVVLALTLLAQKWMEAKDAASGFADRIASTSPNVEENIKRVRAEMEKQNRIANSIPDVSGAAYARMQKDTLGAKMRADELKKKLEELKAARRAEAAAAALEADVTGTISEAMKVASDRTYTMATRLKAVQTALDAAFNASIGVWDAVTKLRSGYDSLSKALAKAKGNFRGNTAASQRLRDAFSSQLKGAGELYSATLRQTSSLGRAKNAAARQIPVLRAMAGGSKGAQRQVTALAQSLNLSTTQVRTNRKSFMRAAAQMGISKGAATRLWKEYKKVPGRVKTKVSNNADGSPKTKVKEYRDWVNSIPRKVTTRFVIVGGPGTGGNKANRLLSSTGATGGLVAGGRIRRFAAGGFADGGGAVRGPGGPTADKVPALLSNGEFVVKASTVRQLGVGFLAALNKGAMTRNIRGTGPSVASADKQFVKLGEVTDRQWQALLAMGWTGKAGDKMEALYPPLDALRRALASGTDVVKAALAKVARGAAGKKPGGFEAEALRLARKFGLSEKQARAHGSDSFVNNFLAGVRKHGRGPRKGSRIFEDGSWRLAKGGTARAGSTYLVGEKGPELFTPGATGHVTPNHKLGAGLGGLGKGMKAKSDQPVKAAQQIAKKVEAVYSRSDSMLRKDGENIVEGLRTGIVAQQPRALKSARGLSTRVRGVYKPAPRWLRPQGKQLVTGFRQGITSQTAVARKSSTNVSKKVRDVYKPAPRWLRPPGKSMVHGLAVGIRSGTPSANKATANSADGVLRRFGKLRNTRNTARYVVNNVMAVLVRRFNSVAKSFGANSAHVPHFRSGGFVKPRRFAEGGQVNGPGGPRGDKIPAMLSDGEFVVNAAATKKNRILLEALNRKKKAPKADTLPEFADGGFVSDKTSDLANCQAAAASGVASGGGGNALSGL